MTMIEMIMIKMMMTVKIINHRHKNHNLVGEIWQLYLEINTAKKKKDKFNCEKGTRIKVTRIYLFHVSINHQQKVVLYECRNIIHFHSTMSSRNSKQGDNMKFDQFSSDWQEVFAKKNNNSG